MPLTVSLDAETEQRLTDLQAEPGQERSVLVQQLIREGWQQRQKPASIRAFTISSFARERGLAVIDAETLSMPRRISAAEAREEDLWGDPYHRNTLAGAAIGSGIDISSRARLLTGFRARTSASTGTEEQPPTRRNDGRAGANNYPNLRVPCRMPKSNSTWAQQLSVAATALGSLSLVPARADAAGMLVTQTISVPGSNGITPWDVDGNGQVDFRLRRYATNYAALSSGTLGPQGLGRGLVGPSAFSNSVSPLSAGFVVGPTMTGGKAFGSSNEVRLATSNGAIDGSFGSFSQGPNYFGFRFVQSPSSSDYLYGWATIVFDQPTSGFSITQWAYSDGPIKVGQDPNAAVPGPLGLAGLAAGAAWTRRLRRRIRQASEAA